MPQSRGYSFVDFSDHVYALACLRELNNNGVYATEYANKAKDENGKVSEYVNMSLLRMSVCI